ncbi:sugar transferase, partial [Mycobacterium tuberculosis]|nr:sugar transferase [Mycobacterium tuberculosis]
VAPAPGGDPRVTVAGRLLRHTGIGALPQLVNVLKGEISVVGPRPHRVAPNDHDGDYDRKIAGCALRQHIKPGITGWAQVNG